MFKKKTAQTNFSPDSGTTDFTITWDDSDPAQSIFQLDPQSTTQAQLQSAQQYYNQMATQMNQTYISGNGGTSGYANVTMTSPTNWYVTSTSQVAYTYAMPYNVPPREAEGMASVPKMPIEKDPEIGIGIDTFLAEKKRQEEAKA